MHIPKIIRLAPRFQRRKRLRLFYLHKYDFLIWIFGVLVGAVNTYCLPRVAHFDFRPETFDFFVYVSSPGIVIFCLLASKN